MLNLIYYVSGELKLGYLKKPYIVTMQTFQMAVLLLFENCDSLTCNEVQETLQLNCDQFGKHVSSLVDCKLLNSSSEVTHLVYLVTNIISGLSGMKEKNIFFI